MMMLLSAYAVAQAPWTGILAPTRAVDWRNAGVQGGIPSRTWTQAGATLAACGTSGSPVSPATCGITAALAGAGANQYVLLGAGTFYLNAGICMETSNQVLRGMGPSKTTIVFTGSSSCLQGVNTDIGIEGTFNWVGGPQNKTTWTAGFTQGATTLTVGSTSGMAATQWVILDQDNDVTDTGNVVIADTTNNAGSCGPPYFASDNSAASASPGRNFGNAGTVSGTSTSCGGGLYPDRNQQQMVLATVVNSTTITISPGLYMPNWSGTKNPGIYWATTPIQNVGIENMTLNHNSAHNTSMQSGVLISNAVNVWMKNVSSLNAPTGTSNSSRNHFWSQYSTHFDVVDSYFWGTPNQTSLSYGVETFPSSDCLIQNNIFQQVVTPYTKGVATGCVFSYNYNIYGNYQTAGWQIPTVDEHEAARGMNLEEGNVGTGWEPDDIHGTGNFSTVFRNAYSGRDVSCDGSPCTSQTIAANVMTGDRYSNIVGNILGTPGYHTIYQTNYASCPGNTTNINVSVYAFGWSGTSGNSFCFTSPYTIAPDTLSASTAMRWGNCDVVSSPNCRFVSGENGSGATAYPALGSPSSSFPPSFYLGSKPTWFGSTPFPAIGPDVNGGNLTYGSGAYANLGGHAYTNPAQNCYNLLGGATNGTGGPITFLPGLCYGAPERLTGTWNLTGQWRFPAQPGGSFYTARTDCCAVGTETNSSCGISSGAGCQTTGCPSSVAGNDACTLSFQIRPTDTAPFAALAASGTNGTDADFHSHLIMVTDTTTGPTTQTYNIGNDNDDTDPFSYDSSVFFVGDNASNGGAFAFFYLYPAVVRATSYPWSGACSGCITPSAISRGVTELTLLSVNGSGVYTGTGLSGQSGNYFTIQGFANPANNLTNAQATGSTATTITFSATTVIETPPAIPGAAAICSQNCQTVDNLGPQSFSRVSTEPYILYELTNDGLHVYRDSICRIGHTADPTCSTAGGVNSADQFSRTLYANFADPNYGILPANYNSLWRGVFGVANDGTVAMAEGGAGDWVASTQYYALASDTNTTPTSFIYPSANGSSCGTAGHCQGFQAVTSGYSYSSEPTAWASVVGASYPTAGGTICDDGSNSVSTGIQACLSVCGPGGTHQCTQWQSIGKLTGQGPGFDLLRYAPAGSPNSPGYSRLNTRILKVYRGVNEGPSFPSSGTSDPSGSLTTDDGSMCAQFGYALNGAGTACSVTTVPFGETFTLHGGSTLENSAFFPATPTGGGSNAITDQAYTPTGTVQACFASNINYRGMWQSGTVYARLDGVFDPANPQNLYTSVANSNIGNALSNTSFWHGALSATGAQDGPVICYKHVWQVNSTIMRVCMSRGVSGNYDDNNCPGHEVHSYAYNIGDKAYVPHTWGALTLTQPCTGPSCYTGVANATPLGSFPAGAGYLPQQIPGDDHGSGHNTNAANTNPLMSARTDVPTATYATVAPITAGQSTAGYGEFVGIKTDGSGLFYRFAHNYNTGSEPSYSEQNNISAVSQDGQWAVIPTDMMDTRGSTSPAWKASTAWTFSSFMFPISGTIASNTVNSGNYDFVATQAGTSGASQPNWNLVQTMGNTICDPNTGDASGGINVSCLTGQVQWKNLGASCNLLRAQFSPAKSTAFASGNVIFPVDSNANDFQYEATNSGTTGATIPTWNSFCGSGYVGQNCPSMDGTVQWKNLGASDCRADMMLVDLLSAH